jgi:aminocarboxymuconate-semialdehyde decarboxylase
LSLPVLIHPTAPPGVQAMQMNEFQLTASIGFTFDTTLAVSRMLYDGFFDRYTRLKIIASHGAGALPYLLGRLDQCFRNIPACRTKTQASPSSYMGRVFADSVVFTQQALDLCLEAFGDEQVLFGSDYPHTIGDPVGCLAKVNSLLGARREKVRGGNAQRIFRF